MVTALILSGGSGTRLGSDIPKQYIYAGDRMIISYSIGTLSGSDDIDAIWIVAADEWRSEIEKSVAIADVNGKFRGFSEPGANRQLSIYNGCRDINDNLGDTDYVFVHDAARPLLTCRDIEDVVLAARGCDGAIPVLPMKDTVYLSSNGTAITGLIDRSTVYAGQAPEIFKLDKYLAANEQLIIWERDEAGVAVSISSAAPILKINGSTEPAIMAGMNIAMIPGNENNYKITTRADLNRFISCLEQ